METVEERYERIKEEYYEKFNSLPFDNRRFLGLFQNLSMIQTIDSVEDDLNRKHKERIASLESWKCQLKKRICHTYQQILNEEKTKNN